MAYDFPANPTVDQVYITNTRIYIWSGYAWISSGSTNAVEDVFVKKDGDTMRGTLVLNADPANPMVAATKQYVDNEIEASVPSTGLPGQALVKNASNAPTWGYPIDGGEV